MGRNKRPNSAVMPPATSLSPTKRRKTSGVARSKMNSRRAKPPIWPPGALPIELFDLICSYLPRSNIQNMRLVNREFERFVSPYLFRWVVVPFKPEIYGISPEPSLSRRDESVNDLPQGAVMLQDKGMRVFQGYGERILKFAMTFEYDENKLSTPPIKSDQEAITSFWGIYRWPFKNYNRYTQLEGLEQTADETRSMSKALRFITKANELGLSIDGGLGWLSGPDINIKLMERAGKVKVFGKSRFVSEPQSKLSFRGGRLARSTSTFTSIDPDSRHTSYERMLQFAGIPGEELSSAVAMMIETELSSERLEALQGQSTLPPASQSVVPGFGGGNPGIPHIAGLTHGESFHVNVDDASPTPLEESDEEEDALEGAALAPNRRPVKTKVESYSLKPNDLTSGQREMLLEIEWAQRAFIQSYVIAIIDNSTTFRKIETLTLARIPGRFIPVLNREDFWEALPQLGKLHMAVIPDWREVVKLPTSYVQDNKVPPSQTISAVYKLLQDQISRRRNITTLHFEWLCGGEQAPGLFARNHHVLGAPIVSRAIELLDRQGSPQVLSLPYIKHLSFKNCWFTPHILQSFCSTLKRTGLETLAFDSVSLTAPVPPNVLPNPVILPNAAQNAQNAQNGVQIQPGINFPNMVAQAGAAGPVGAPAGMLQQAMAAQAMMAAGAAGVAGAAVPLGPFPVPVGLPVNQNASDLTDYEKFNPRNGSWASVIEALTPCRYKSLAFRHEEVDEPDAQPSSHNPSHIPSLQKLEFNSCGYVMLSLDINQSMIEAPPAPPQPTAQSHAILKRTTELESIMMKPSPTEYTLGDVVNHMGDIEQWQLVNGFFFSVGWPETEEYQTLRVECAADGVTCAGEGRFSGVIRHTDRKPSI
ncbi:hypothetical protein B0O99DRAFT_606539 [Bisporella sp. PMI_857]|nr:hypothetical protein B0O99DRAFT_606539 [Bisporella sp. PMI_857]